jgi:hypothetical protein
MGDHSLHHSFVLPEAPCIRLSDPNLGGLALMICSA